MNDLKTLKRVKKDEIRGFPNEIFQLRADSIRPNRSQPRAVFDDNAILRLADSIRRYGILQPLTVRHSEDDDMYEYELIAGERRLRAARMLGYFTVPCIIVHADEQTSAEMAIIENLLREDLNMFEQAYGFRKLLENHNLTQEEVARRMSLSQSAIANKLRLLKLNYEEQTAVLELGLTERHARALLRLKEGEKRMETIRKIAAEGWNVQESERYIEALAKDEVRVQRALQETQQAIKRNAEQEAEALIKALKRDLERIQQEGRSVSVDVRQGLRTVDISIKIAKESLRGNALNPQI